MRIIEAGTAVKSGHYMSARTWMLHPVATDGERLPGAAGERFVRIPALAAFLVAPLLGALFLVFLPLIGFFLTGLAASRPAARLASRLATRFAATVEPGWEPGLAHLTGKGARARAVPVASDEEEDPLDELEREIAALRSARGATASR